MKYVAGYNSDGTPIYRERAESGPAGTASDLPKARTSPEVRAQILQMFKRSNSKYAKPFDKDRLAAISIFGGNWEEYGQIILQMAILDTLLSIEEKLDGRKGGDSGPQSL
jgi:hypothetical protein